MGGRGQGGWRVAFWPVVAAGRHPVSFLAFYLTGLLAMVSAMGMVLYLAGAVGVFDDPPRTRVEDAIVAVGLLIVVTLLRSLAGRLGHPLDQEGRRISRDARGRDPRRER